MADNPYSLFDEQAQANPYPVYKQIRDDPAVYFEPMVHGLLVSRYADVEKILRSKDVATMKPMIMPPEDLDPDLKQMHTQITDHMSGWFTFIDPPEHTPLRKYMNQSFKLSLVKEMRTSVEDICNSLVDAMRGKSKIDFINDYALHVPGQVIADMLGFPKAKREAFNAWSMDMALYLGDYTYSNETLIRNGHAAVTQMRAALFELIDERRRDPAADLISSMLSADADIPMPDERIVSFALFLLFAGHETTMSFLGNGMKALLENPEQLALLRQDMGRLKTAVPEFLRYDPPNHYVTRSLTAPMTLGDVTFETGTRFMLMVAAANHDPSVFENPEILDITRRPNPHLSFGVGIHYCLGAPMAIMQGEVAFSTFLRRVRDISFEPGEVHRRPSPFLRGLQRLPLTIGQVTD